jgi:hypothetical protein
VFLRIARVEVPRTALLRRYDDEGAYTDCYVAQVATSFGFSDYVEAFYTTLPFKLERLVLRWLVAKPSSDADARRLAREETDSFAAWSVEARASDQLLVCDFLSRTRSWLMIAPVSAGSALYFGTAILPVGIGSRKGRLGFPFNALLGFHRIYSRVLLGAARSRLLGRRRTETARTPAAKVAETDTGSQ